MKLAEALILRADLQKRVQQLRARLINNCKVQEGDEPYEEPEKLFEELNSDIDEVTELIQKINRTNSKTSFNDKYSLADILAIRDGILHKRNTISSLIEEAMVKQDRYSMSEVKFCSTINVKEYQKKLDDLSKQYRELDTKIQNKNWTIDLI